MFKNESHNASFVLFILMNIEQASHTKGGASMPCHAMVNLDKE
jgi:hypothetical protein